jgi:hypothetical protein
MSGTLIDYRMYELVTVLSITYKSNLQEQYIDQETLRTLCTTTLESFEDLGRLYPFFEEAYPLAKKTWCWNVGLDNPKLSFA